MDDQVASHRYECTQMLETRFGGDSGRPPSVAVVEAVAAAEGVSPAELDPIYDDIDPGAIDRLFDGPSDDGTSTVLRFSIDGWRVFVRGDGAIRVCDPDSPTDPGAVFEKAIDD